MRLPLASYWLSQGYSSGHRAWDLAAGCGTKIKSPVTGIVIGDGEDAGYIGGKYVIVRESAPRGYEFYMGHMSSNNVVKGQKVKEGQTIGRVGQTGYATGCHVHFQIRRKGGGALINPGTLSFKKPSPVKKAAQKVSTYIVKRGDTLGKIANKFKTTWQKLWKKNPQIKNPNVIKPGQKIKVTGTPKNKAPAKKYLKVKKGEGISHLAKRAGFKDWSKQSRWKAIAKLNGSSNWKTYNAKLKPNKKVRVK